MNREPCISFDLDDTLFEGYSSAWGGSGIRGIMDFIETLESYHALGCRIIIITARRESFENVREIERLLTEYNIRNCVSKIHFTNHELKGPTAFREGSVLHYDDDIYQLTNVAEHGIKVINSKPDQLYAHVVR